MKPIEIILLTTTCIGLIGLGIAGDKYYEKHPKPIIKNETNVNTYKPNIYVGKELVKTNKIHYGGWRE